MKLNKKNISAGNQKEIEIDKYSSNRYQKRSGSQKQKMKEFDIDIN